MSEIDNHLQRLQGKLQQLLKQYQLLRQENQRLKAELDGLTLRDQVQQEAIVTLRQQVDIMKLSTGQMNARDKQAMEKRINLYIKEIDRCIALLSE